MTRCELLRKSALISGDNGLQQGKCWKRDRWAATAGSIHRGEQKERAEKEISKLELRI